MYVYFGGEQEQCGLYLFFLKLFVCRVERFGLRDGVQRGGGELKQKECPLLL